MRLEIEVGLYNQDIARCLKWYSSLYKDKHPSKDDERLFQKLTLFYEDMLLQDKEAIEEYGRD